MASSKQNAMPIAGILSGALVWGLIWYPFRLLNASGMSGTATILVTYSLAMLCGMFIFKRLWKELRAASGWTLGLILSAGWSNLGYVMGMLHGEVMRVLLLFYLAPLWAIIFSYWLLGERLTRYGYFVMALSFSGAFIMLWTPQRVLPLPQNISEWLGLSAGMSFALSNVVSRRAFHLSITAKSYSVLFGTVLLAIPLVWWEGGFSKQLMEMNMQSWVLLVLLGIVLCGTAFAVQYGIANMVSNRAMLLFLFELVVAALSSYLLANETMHAREWIGALLIVSASLLSGKIQEGSLSRYAGHIPRENT